MSATASPQHELPLAAGGRLLARRWARALASTRTAQIAIGAAVAPMLAITLSLALSSDHLERPLTTGLYFAYLTGASITIGLYWWVRRSASRIGPLLVTFGFLVWVVSLQSSDRPLLFDVAILAEGPTFLVTFFLFLSFPTGRLESAAARWLMAALAIGVVAFFLPWALFSPVIAGGGPLTACAPNCPENVLQIGSAPKLVEVVGKAETYTALAITLATLLIYGMRVRRASRPQRRALMAVAVTSLLFLPAYFTFNFAAWILHLDPATLETLAWGIVFTRILLPLGFLVALLQAQLFAGKALRSLLELLAGRPSPRQWREMIATSLDDASLRLAYYDPASGRFRDVDGAELAPGGVEAGRRWVPIERDEIPVAAMIIDGALAEDPELVRAAASATLLAVENGHLEGELRASRARILEAGHAERRRIERDLHDSAQQRLVALRIHLSLTSEQVERVQERELLERLGVEVDETIDELRTLARGLYPQELARSGIASALHAVAGRSAIPVTIESAGLGRQSEAVEMTVYFCCLECLQNAAKHAGRGARATIRLGERAGRVQFCVEDDGSGFDPRAAERGAGLTNLEDRVAAVGGWLRVDSAPGRGTTITGEIPV
jgi:signal transduction histidine kinase